MQMTLPQHGVIGRKLHWSVYGLDRKEQDFLNGINDELKFDRQDASVLIDKLMILSVPRPLDIELDAMDKAVVIVKSLLKKYGYS